MNIQKTRELVIMGVLTGIVFLGQVFMGFLPNVEIVTLLFILYTLVFGKKVFLDDLCLCFPGRDFYGFGLWWLNYLYVWSVQSVITWLSRKQKSVLFWSVLSGFYGISFGALCTIPYFFISGPAGAFAYWVSGVAYDIPHCIGNVVLCLILFRPLRSLLEKMVSGNFEKPVHN